MWRKLKSNRIVAAVIEVAGSFGKHDAVSLAAAVAFYTAFSFAPLVLLIVTVGGIVGSSTQDSLIQLFENQLGPRAGEVTQAVMESAADRTASDNGWRWATGIVLLLISSSAVFGQLQSSLNTIWEVPSRRHAGLWSWIRKRLLSLGMVLAALFILLVSLVLTSVVERVVPSGEGSAARVAAFAISFLISTALFAAIFRVLPDTDISWRHVWWGALITAALFSAGKVVLGVYLSHSSFADNYGRASGALVALLVWVYYSCMTLFAGAEIARYHTKNSAPRAPAPR